MVRLIAPVIKVSSVGDHNEAGDAYQQAPETLIHDNHSPLGGYAQSRNVENDQKPNETGSSPMLTHTLSPFSGIAMSSL